MYKIILMLLLSGISSNAMAEFIGPIKKNNYIDLYVEPFQIDRVGNMAKMWSMYNLNLNKVINGFVYKSIRTHQEFDCKEKRVKNLWTGYMSEYDSGGTVLYVDGAETDHHTDSKWTDWHNWFTPKGWKSVSSDNFGNIEWEIACGKRSYLQ